MSMDATDSEQPRLSSELARPAADVATRDAVLEVYDRHQRGIYTFLLSATRDADAAQDLLQETFLRLFREASVGRMPVNQHAWLYRVAGNLVLSGGRRQQTARRWQERQSRLDEHVPSPEERYLVNERHAALMDCLDEIGPDARVGLLMAAHGFGGPEIATALGRSPLAVRSLLCRARLRLRDLLLEREVAL
jgi:RNA polymerase sigma-70 factor (ECF subfamily)